VTADCGRPLAVWSFQIASMRDFSAPFRPLGKLVEAQLVEARRWRPRRAAQCCWRSQAGRKVMAQNDAIHARHSVKKSAEQAPTKEWLT
jgi:hypothetical protein